jgi:hypothetical protein
MYLFSLQKWLVSKNIQGPPQVGTPFNCLKYYHATLFYTHSSLRLYIDSSHVYTNHVRVHAAHVREHDGYNSFTLYGGCTHSP